MLRLTNAVVPIVMVSGLDRTKSAIEAGATAFLSYDAWLRIGTVVSELLPENREASPHRAEPDATPTTGR